MTKFLGPALTAGYRPALYGWSIDVWRTGQRGFRLHDVEEMRRDPQINFGLSILSAPVFRAKVTVTPADEVGKFVAAQFRRFWRRDLVHALRTLAWGFMPAEVLYREKEGRIEFDQIRDLHPLDVRPKEIGGRISGLTVGTLFGTGGPVLRPPRLFWAALDPEYGGHYGRSRLFGAWAPWQEKTARHGALDVRRNWYMKNAFRGGVIRHPPGVVELGDGVTMSCQDYAREILEKFETGGILVLPSGRDPESGEYLWVYEPPQSNGPQQDIRDYPKDLDAEMLRGMTIPPEVVDAAESGSGWSGRSVPFLVFLTGEDRIVECMIDAFDRWVCRPLVAANFGARDYEVTAESLTELAEMPEQPQEPGAPPAANRKTGPKDLIPYRGPKGGQGQLNPATGRISYG